MYAHTFSPSEKFLVLGRWFPIEICLSTVHRYTPCMMMVMVVRMRIRMMIMMMIMIMMLRSCPIVIYI
jgi:hypothetical protein